MVARSIQPDGCHPNQCLPNELRRRNGGFHADAVSRAGRSDCRRISSRADRKDLPTRPNRRGTPLYGGEQSGRKDRRSDVGAAGEVLTTSITSEGLSVPSSRHERSNRPISKAKVLG